MRPLPEAPAGESTRRLERHDGPSPSTGVYSTRHCIYIWVWSRIQHRTWVKDIKRSTKDTPHRIKYAFYNLACLKNLHEGLKASSLNLRRSLCSQQSVQAYLIWGTKLNEPSLKLYSRTQDSRLIGSFKATKRWSS